MQHWKSLKWTKGSCYFRTCIIDYITSITLCSPIYVHLLISVLPSVRLFSAFFYHLWSFYRFVVITITWSLNTYSVPPQWQFDRCWAVRAGCFCNDGYPICAVLLRDRKENKWGDLDIVTSLSEAWSELIQINIIPQRKYRVWARKQMGPCSFFHLIFKGTINL